MNKIYFLLFFLLTTTAVQAIEPVDKALNSINKRSAEAYIGFLASDALEGREAGYLGSYVASEYIKSLLMDMGINPIGEDYFQPFEAYSRERQTKSKYQVNPDSIVVFTQQRAYRKLSLRNVLGMIEGENTNEFVIVGAHFDHIGMDKDLVGDQIYNGADDNASGVSAVLQIAKAFMTSGKKPKRNVIFAFWDGEEKNLLGSEYFMLNCPFIPSIKGYLNFDMIGRNNDETKPKHVVYFYTESKPIYGEWLKKDIQKYRLDIEPDYRAWDNPVGGSDNGNFATRNIPIIWYHTDGHPDYHQPSDEVDKINWNKLIEITKASFLNMWHMANDKDI